MLAALATLAGARLTLAPRDVYVAGQNDTAGTTYACFRIPTLLRTNDAVLAFAEGRRGGCGDQGDVRIVQRVSRDGGLTFGPIVQVLHEAGHTIGNPSPIFDSRSGEIVMLYARDDNELFVTSSRDGGATWAAPTNVTAALKPNPDPEAWVATGPPGGVQLPSGRLVTAAYYNRADQQTRAYAVFSDDGGRTWERGADVEPDSTPGRQVWGGGESQVVPFGGGEGLAMLIRARTLAKGVGDVGHNHALAFSTDGGATFSNSTRMAIETVYCEGSLAAAGNGDLLVSSPSTNNGVRADLSLFAASKAAPTNFTKVLTLYTGASAYSSMLCGESSCLNLFEIEGSKAIALVAFKYP